MCSYTTLPRGRPTPYAVRHEAVNDSNGNECMCTVKNFLSGAGCFTSNKPFEFGVDSYQDPDPGIFIRIFTTARRGQL